MVVRTQWMDGRLCRKWCLMWETCCLVKVWAHTRQFVHPLHSKHTCMHVYTVLYCVMGWICFCSWSFIVLFVVLTQSCMGCSCTAPHAACYSLPATNIDNMATCLLHMQLLLLATNISGSDSNHVSIFHCLSISYLSFEVQHADCM